MKKPYVKPDIQFIRFDLSESIASSGCAAQLYNHASRESCQLLPPYDSLGIDFNFGTGDGVKCSTPIEGYCYFTATTNTLFSS